MKLNTVISTLLLLNICPLFVHADTTITGNSQITGQVGVGTVSPRARLEAKMAASDNFALKVSSQDGTSLMLINKAGKMGIGVSDPQAKVDIFGSGDNSNIGLQLRVGNSSSSISSSQIAFAYPSTGTYRHSLRTQSVNDQSAFNTMGFYLWKSTGAPTDLGAFHVMSLQANGSTTSVHILPTGAPDAELEVSNSTTTGGGTIHRVAAGVHSSRDLKTDIVYFNQDQESRAYQEMKSLKHARFRYKAVIRDPKTRKSKLVRNTALPMTRGLIYEETPSSIHGPNQTIILDYRVINLELALKEVNRKIEDLESQIISIENKRKGK